MFEELPKLYDHKLHEEPITKRWLEADAFAAVPDAPRRALRHHDAPAQRHRRPPHGPRHGQRHAGPPHPLAPDDGRQHPLDARHRPRRDRHPGGRREAALRARGQDAPRHRPRGARGPDPGLEGRIPGAHHPPAAEHGLFLRLEAPALHDGRRSAPGPSARRSSACSATGSSTAATAWSTGTASSRRPSPTTRSSTRRSRDTSGTSSTRSSTRGRASPPSSTVATTRPETMLGDTAVAVPSRSGRRARTAGSRPSRNGWRRRRRRTGPSSRPPWSASRSAGRPSSRASSSSGTWRARGRKVLLPLLDRPIPLILDEWADPALGSGCVKITPGPRPQRLRRSGSATRTTIGIINILNPDGTLNANAGPYAGPRPLRGPEAGRRRPQGPRAHRGHRGPGDRDRPLRPVEDPDRALSSPSSGSSGWATSRAASSAAPGRGRNSARRAWPRPPSTPSGDDYRSPSGPPADLPSRPRPLRRDLPQLAGREARLVHQPPALVGPPHPHLARESRRAPRSTGAVAALPRSGDTGLCMPGSPTPRGASTARHRPRASGPRPALRPSRLVSGTRRPRRTPRGAPRGGRSRPGPRRPRHLVQLGPLAVQHARLARPGDGGARPRPAAPRPRRRPATIAWAIYYPGSCLVTARDIITLWVARMQIMGLYLLGRRARSPTASSTPTSRTARASG